MLKTKTLGWGLVLCCALVFSGCGYYFPHVYEGAHRVVYMQTWKNRTNKLGLDMKIYQSLSRWFQKTEAVDLTKEKSGADLILAGEILSIDLPSVSWNSVSDATGTKVQLYVRYALKDLKTGKILWEVPNKLYTADYTVQTATSAADDEALSKIIDDMSEHIYLGVLNKLRKQQTQAQPAN
ncbi:LPS assembly lipoprotein LptE [Desulfobulbus sp.]|jgi:hypothetical protein|uniref:LPS assembly lipoprotein LptE n=1 Tax=Desulfobulbus sp. TaxID=895 RepID=UPI0027B9844B|nr:LPS assembly lipoprotein LptE [Desulfobulbus sp.]